MHIHSVTQFNSHFLTEPWLADPGLYFNSPLVLILKDY